MQSKWSVWPNREACRTCSKQWQEVIHLLFLRVRTVAAADSGAKPTRGFSSLLRGSIRVENPRGPETNSERFQQVSSEVTGSEKQAARSRLCTLSLWLCSSFSVVLLHVSTPESFTWGSHHSASSSWERSQNRTTVFCLSDGA